MAVALRQLIERLDRELQPSRWNDYAPNGLQVEGRPWVERLVTGVTASQRFIEQALAMDADAVLVHHGLFWRGDSPVVTGMKKRRLATLLGADLTVLAYHLPLDAHPRLGNNTQLALRLGLPCSGVFADASGRELIQWGAFSEPMAASVFAEHVSHVLGRSVQHIPGGTAWIQRIAWCTGAAQQGIQIAIEQGMDAYLSGEISEPTVHAAMESGIHYFAAGHHATELYGIQALGAWVAQELGIEHHFIDCPVDV